MITNSKLKNLEKNYNNPEYKHIIDEIYKMPDKTHKYNMTNRMNDFDKKVEQNRNEMIKLNLLKPTNANLKYNSVVRMVELSDELIKFLDLRGK